MGNHSETGELLEEAREIAITDGNTIILDSLIDEFGNTIKLDQSPDELQAETKLANPTQLKDSSGRAVDLITDKTLNMLTLKQIKAMEAKRNKKKAS